MAQLLADEMLLQIFSYIIYVPDEDFADVSGRASSPFGRHPYSESGVLRVCKRWLRIATPLLYDTVVLRVTSQAKSLARALEAHAEFGLFIRKLRFEGGFAAASGKILRAAPRLRELHISLELTSRDNVDAMCKALPAVSPSRLILSVERRPYPINPVAAAQKGIREAAKSWKSLTTLVLPYEAVRGQMVLDALYGLENVAEVTVPDEITRISALSPVLRRWPKCTIHIWAENIQTADQNFTDVFMARYSGRMRVH